MVTSEWIAKINASISGETEDAEKYKKLAEETQDDGEKQILLDMSHEEMQHYEHLKWIVEHHEMKN